jgi:uncharacterized DUF497 family protein
MVFEWDEEKRRANIAKHGIDFVRATAIFDGRPYLDLQSLHRDEPRLLRIAMLDGVFCTVVWTLRATDAVRIISVRRSRDGEKARYRALHG